VQGQDEIAALRRLQVIRVLDPLGNPLAGQHLADVVKRREGSQIVVGDLGVDGHIGFFSGFLCCLPGTRRAAQPDQPAAPLGLSARRASHTVRAVANRSRIVRTLARLVAGKKRWPNPYPRKKSPTASMSRPARDISGALAGAAPISLSATARTRVPASLPCRSLPR